MKLYDVLKAEVQAILSDQGNTKYPDFVSLDSAFDSAVEELTNPPPAILVPNWTYFNEATGGLRPREFSIICGPTGAGKTTWLANLSANLLTGGVRQFVASVETGYTDFALRLMSALDQRDFNTGRQFERDVADKFLADYSSLIRSKGIHLARYTNKINPLRMLCDLKYAHDELKCKVAILDNLNFFLPFVEAESAVVSMDKVIHDFIVFCKHIDLHVFMVMHPKKTDNGRVNSEFDIKGSSGAVQEAHNVFLFNRPTAQDESNGFDRRTHRDLIFAKLRRRGGNTFRRIMYQNVNSSYVERAFL